MIITLNIDPSLIESDVLHREQIHFSESLVTVLASILNFIDL